MKLRAVKGLTYATRRLLPGDVFDAKSRRDGRILLATRKVEAVREPVKVAPPPPVVAAKIATAVADDRVALRGEYEAALGKKPFHGWSADELREKIAAAKT